MGAVKDELLSVKEAAARRGVSPSTVQKWIDKKQLPAFPIAEVVAGGRGWAIRAEDLDRFEPPPACRPRDPDASAAALYRRTLRTRNKK